MTKLREDQVIRKVLTRIIKKGLKDLVEQELQQELIDEKKLEILKAKELSEKEKDEEIQEYDYHSIREEWDLIKSIIEEGEKDMSSLLRQKNQRAARRTRERLQEIRKLCFYMRKSVTYQLQDNKSGYD